MPTIFAFEVDVIVVMMSLRAGFATQGILRIPAIVEHFVQYPFFKKRAQSAVNSHPVVRGAQPRFDVAVRKRMIGPQKQVEYLFAALCVPQIKVFEGLCSVHFLNG